jgi:hypothetical protein
MNKNVTSEKNRIYTNLHIRQPDGTFIVNKFWNEIYNHENASPSLNQAQATPGTSQLAPHQNDKL